MKNQTILILLASAAFSHANSEFDRELARLTEQRDRLVAEAVEPIESKYKDALKALLLRANQAKDTNAAKEIQAALQNSPSPDSDAGSNEGTVVLTKLALERRLRDVTYVTDSNSWLQKMTFEKGRIIHNPNEKGQGRSAPFQTIDGSTVTHQWDGHLITLSFSPDLKTLMRGTVKYTLEP